MERKKIEERTPLLRLIKRKVNDQTEAEINRNFNLSTMSQDEVHELMDATVVVSDPASGGKNTKIEHHNICRTNHISGSQIIRAMRLSRLCLSF